MDGKINKGTRVRIMRETDRYEGKTGVVSQDFDPKYDDLVAVKGLEGRLKEHVMGHVSFAPEDLERA